MSRSILLGTALLLAWSATVTADEFDPVAELSSVGRATLRLYAGLLHTDDCIHRLEDSEGGWRIGFASIVEQPMSPHGEWAFLIGPDFGFERREMTGLLSAPSAGSSGNTAMEGQLWQTMPQVMAALEWQAQNPPMERIHLSVVDLQLALGPAWRFAPRHQCQLEVLTRGGVGLGSLDGEAYYGLVGGAAVGFLWNPPGWRGPRLGIETGYAWRTGKADGATYRGGGFCVAISIGFID